MNDLVHCLELDRGEAYTECPKSHLDALDLCLRESLRILVIGWRGAERHFLERLKSLPGMAPAVSIVGRSEEGTDETVANLASVGLTQTRMGRYTQGFSNYLETEPLEEFLATELFEWRGLT